MASCDDGHRGRRCGLRLRLDSPLSSSSSLDEEEKARASRSWREEMQEDAKKMQEAVWQWSRGVGASL